MLERGECIRRGRNPFHCGFEERVHQMQRKFAVALALFALLGTAPLLSACYTTAGAGKDLQAAGQGISHSAQENTTYRP
jgi:predicted small secreted protein